MQTNLNLKVINRDGINEDKDSLDSLIRINKLGKAAISYKDNYNILTKASGFINTYDYTLNPYSGCSFGCSYCYAAFFNNKKDVNDWGNWVWVKQNALDLLRNYKIGSLSHKLIYMSSVTDAYQPLENKLKLSRSLLKCFIERKHKVKLVIQTRSPLVERDLDLFSEIVRIGGRVQINMTVTTDDEEVRKSFEPICPSNKLRIKSISNIATYAKENNININTCITMTPLLLVYDADTFINDLINTGVGKLIIQPFHFNKGEFIAKTREPAIQAMINKLGTGCNRDNFQEKYLQHYNNIRVQLIQALNNSSIKIDLGEGKSGFAPIF